MSRQAPSGAVVPFYMYEGPELDFGYLRHCAGFTELQRSAYNERLAEVYLRDALANHPWRTRSAAAARLLYVPVWEVVSFNVGECNGTSHVERMARAAKALRAAPTFRSHGSRPAGYDHILASSGCIERDKRLAQRLTEPLARLLRAAIVGRDRACASPSHERRLRDARATHDASATRDALATHNASATHMPV